MSKRIDCFLVVTDSVHAGWHELDADSAPENYARLAVQASAAVFAVVELLLSPAVATAAPLAAAAVEKEPVDSPRIAARQVVCEAAALQVKKALEAFELQAVAETADALDEFP